jgi:hypothetical protein
VLLLQRKWKWEEMEGEMTRGGGRGGGSELIKVSTAAAEVSFID